MITDDHSGTGSGGVTAGSGGEAAHREGTSEAAPARDGHDTDSPTATALVAGVNSDTVGGTAPRRRISERKLAANRANALKSTGPQTEEGKRRVSQNGLKRRSIRLLGLAEARTLRQEPGAAEKLYRELIAPYEPAPALLAAHFEDFARMRLELEAWERIRDARIERRWQESDIERRQACYEMERALHGKAREVLETGLIGLPDSPAKARKQAECLGLLKDHLMDGNFDVGPMLRLLYGEKLEPDSDRSQTICIRCGKLMSQGGNALAAEDLEELVDLVEQEEREALTAYGLHLDKKTVTRSARLAGLGGSREDRWIELQGDRLRRAIDRKQRVIIALLQMFKLSAKKESDSSSRRDLTNIKNIEASRATRFFGINKSSQKTRKSKANQTHRKPTSARRAVK